MTLRALAPAFSVCKVADWSLVSLDCEFCFAANTDGERSLVCPTAQVPQNAVAREDGWRALRIEGTLDFSLVGILARISTLLADAKIGIFAVSTYDTDYVFTKAENFDRAIAVLADAGYDVA